jgi:hypothetical protein
MIKTEYQCLWKTETACGVHTRSFGQAIVGRECLSFRLPAASVDQWSFATRTPNDGDAHPTIRSLPKGLTCTPAYCYSTVWRENKFTVNADKLQIDLIKLTSGDRLLRLSDPDTDLTLEKKLSATEPIVRQKAALIRVFQTAMAQAAVATY